jgi:predicted small lipoprotein YifL
VTRLVQALLIGPVLAVLLAGCGLKGPLYLPEKSKEVVVRPGPAATSTPAAGTGAAAEAPPTSQVPEEGPATAPEVPDETMTQPPAPPENPTPSPPGSEGD